jgi:hypothetical protein
MLAARRAPAQPVPLALWHDRARQSAQQCPVVADHRHLCAVHPQRDPLTGQLEADVDLGTGQAHQADGVDHPLDLDRGAGPGRERGWSGGASAVGGLAGQLGDAEPGRQGLEPVTVQQDIALAHAWRHLMCDRSAPLDVRRT